MKKIEVDATTLTAAIRKNENLGLTLQNDQLDRLERDRA